MLLVRPPWSHLSLSLHDAVRGTCESGAADNGDSTSKGAPMLVIIVEDLKMVSSFIPETKSTEGEGFLCCLDSSFEVLCILTPLLRLSFCFVSRIMEGAGDGGGYIESGVSIRVGPCFSTVDQQLSSTCNGLGCIVLNHCFPHDSYCTHSLIDKKRIVLGFRTE